MMDIKDILSYLPHRYPFLLIDKVLSETDTSLVALKNVTINEPFFLGHFPEQPVMPGVMILEALAQASGIIILKSDADISKERDLFLLVAVDNVRFKQMVVPGDQLHLHVELVRHKQGIYKFKGTAMVNGQVACTAELMNARRLKHDT